MGDNKSDAFKDYVEYKEKAPISRAVTPHNDTLVQKLFFFLEKLILMLL